MAIALHPTRQWSTRRPGSAHRPFPSCTRTRLVKVLNTGKLLAEQPGRPVAVMPGFSWNVQGYWYSPMAGSHTSAAAGPRCRSGLAESGDTVTEVGDKDQGDDSAPDGQESGQGTSHGTTRSRGRSGTFASTRPYPRRSLEQALRVPRAIRENNAGNEWASKEVAAALRVGSGSGNFFYLSAASRDFGLSVGTRDTATIKLTDLGRQAVYPGSDEEEAEALRTAFLSVDIFRRVLEYYKGNNLPERRFLSNTLQTTFGLDPAFHDEFLELFDKNCRFVGIGAEYTPGERLGSRVYERGKPAGKDAVILAEPPAPAPGSPVCFVIMPFTERDDRHLSGFFNEVLANLFTPAAIAAGFEVKTAKRRGSDIIQSTIVNELLEADLVLADLTEHNPNVLFELGMRMAQDKPVVLVRAKGTGAIFDVDNMLRVEEYNPSLWKTAIEKDVPRLTEHIVAAWENRESVPTFMKILRPQG